MAEFEHLRHKPADRLKRPRELILACPPLRSSVNLSRIVRAASCFGVTRMVVAGNTRIDAKIARDGADQVELTRRRTLPPALEQLSQDGYEIVGLEQTTNSVSLFEFPFQRRCALVLGHERTGMDDATLARVDRTVEIPVYGLPHSFNVATAAIIAMYEYCRQFPDG